VTIPDNGRRQTFDHFTTSLSQLILSSGQGDCFGRNRTHFDGALFVNDLLVEQKLADVLFLLSLPSQVPFLFTALPT
jgi:hypothetical protein